jgi:hypothetical protein
MIFYGFGPKEKRLQLDAEHILILNYSHFHLFFIFMIAWGQRYSLATLTPTGWAVRSLSDQEAVQLQAKERLSLNLWQQWGLLLTLGILAAVAVFFNILN